MNPLEDEVGFKPTARGPWLLVIIHEMLWIGLGLLLYLVVPRFEAIFADFGVDLPALTVLLVKISRFVVRYWWVVLAMLVLLAPVDRAILEHLRRSPGGRRAVRLWSGLVIALPLAAFVLMVVALFFPATQVMVPHNLSG
jgi:type II secretory pathway component PulF